MGYNIGPKIGIDGESEFRDQIRKINDAYKALDAETRALTASFDAQGDEQGKLEATTKQLQKQIDKQKEKMVLLEDAVKKASDKYGESSIEATRLRGALYDTQATVSKLEGELRSASSQLDHAGDAMENLAEEAEDAGDSVVSLGDMLKANLASGVILDVVRDIGSAVKDIALESIEAASDVRAASAQFEQTFGDMKDIAEDSLDDISDDLKIAVTRMQGSYTKIFAFTKSVGADSAAALDISNRAMRAAADSAAHYDKTIEEATETLQSFLKGNYANDAALGIAATETARNAKANELYATSFQKLSESQKVDVLLAMVEAGNKASGALGSAAREAEEWTNVTGELSESWHQFLGVIGGHLLDGAIPAIQATTKALGQMSDALSSVSASQELADSISNFEKAVDDANEKLDRTENEINAAAHAAGYYVTRLEELEAAGLTNAVVQKEYALIVEELNKLIPELNLTINEQTGLVEGNISAIRADIEAWKEYATASAIQEKFSEVLKAQGSAKASLITAQARLNILEREATELAAQRSKVTLALDASLGELNEAQREYDRLLNTGSEEWLKAAERLDAAKSSVEKLTQEHDSLQTAIDNNFYSQQALSREVADANEVLASYEGEIQVAEEASRLFGQTSGEVNENISAQADALAETESAIAALRDAYADAKEESLDSINTQIGLFEELTQKSDYSASKILENWQNQQRAFLEYRDNLKAAVDMGLDEVLVQQLSDGSQESMMILDALVNDTEISIDEINAAFGDLSKSKEALASTLGQMKVLASGEFSDIVAMAQSSGINVVDGLILGVKSRQEAYRATLAGVGKYGMVAFNEAMEIRSPARKMIPSGELTVDGAIVGVESRAKAYEEAMYSLALAGENAFLAAQLDRVGSYPSIVQTPVSSSRTVSHNYGGIHIDIHQQPGESGEDLAYRIMEIMQQEVDAKGAGLHA